MTKSMLLQLHLDLCNDARALMSAKNDDYAHGADPFANFNASTVFNVDPRVGLLLRMQDKLKRLHAYAERGNLQVENEGWKDSVLDVINYAILYAGMTYDAAAKEDTPSVFEDFPLQSWPGPPSENPQWAVDSTFPDGSGMELDMHGFRNRQDGELSRRRAVRDLDQEDDG